MTSIYKLFYLKHLIRIQNRKLKIIIFHNIIYSGFELIASGAEQKVTQTVPKASTTSKSAATALPFPTPSTTLAFGTPNSGHINGSCNKWNMEQQ
jgi:hypothetical protein